MTLIMLVQALEEFEDDKEVPGVIRIGKSKDRHTMANRKRNLIVETIFV